MYTRVLTVVALSMMLAPGTMAQDKLKPKDIEVAPHWIYDDVPAAFAQARKTGKPILALFR